MNDFDRSKPPVVVVVLALLIGGCVAPVESEPQIRLDDFAVCHQTWRDGSARTCEASTLNLTLVDSLDGPGWYCKLAAGHFAVYENVRTARFAIAYEGEWPKGDVGLAIAIDPEGRAPVTLSKFPVPINPIMLLPQDTRATEKVLVQAFAAIVETETPVLAGARLDPQWTAKDGDLWLLWALRAEDRTFYFDPMMLGPYGFWGPRDLLLNGTDFTLAIHWNNFGRGVIPLDILSVGNSCRQTPLHMPPHASNNILQDVALGH
ncbi:MAG TPA: hypothetical protein VM889_01920 [Candidatus Thermoplasmatota archaeon]|jgi:hypothetical protein|nr:hypothetical protein [Candidatus Thermoplasmatota archaeon]